METGKDQNRFNSPRHLEKMKVHSSKTIKFCEASSAFAVDSIKNEAIQRAFLNFGT